MRLHPPLDELVITAQDIVDETSSEVCLQQQNDATMCGQDWILGRDGTIALARNDGDEWLLCLRPGDRKRTPQRPRNGR